MRRVAPRNPRFRIFLALLPGSALFLVWTQQRDDFQPVGDFDLRRGVTHVLDAQADNVFLVKVSYHLGL